MIDRERLIDAITLDAYPDAHPMQRATIRRDVRAVLDALQRLGYAVAPAEVARARESVRRGMEYVEQSLRGEAIDPIEAGEGYRCPECHTTTPRAHKMDCSVGRKQ